MPTFKTRSEMKNMRSIDRVMQAVNHRERARVPRDYWATLEVTDRLQKELGLSSEEELLRRLGIDLRYYRGPSYTGEPFKTHGDGIAEDLWGPPEEDDRPWRRLHLDLRARRPLPPREHPVRR